MTVSVKDVKLLKRFIAAKKTINDLLGKMTVANIDLDCGWGAGGDGWCTESFTLTITTPDGKQTVTDFTGRYEFLPWPSQFAVDLKPLLSGVDWVTMDVQYSVQEYYADEEFGHYSIEGTPVEIIEKLESDGPDDEDDNPYGSHWQDLG